MSAADFTPDEREALRLADGETLATVVVSGGLLHGVSLTTDDLLGEYGVSPADEATAEERKEQVRRVFFKIAVYAITKDRAVEVALAKRREKVLPEIRPTLKDCERLIYLAKVFRARDREDREKDHLVEPAEEEPLAPDDDLDAEAREILTAGDPIAYLLDTFHTEHVRDDTIAKCCYVSAASRVVENTHGLHVLTTGGSGKGKSSSYGTVLKQIPNESQIGGTLTDKALFYHNIPERAILVLDDKGMSEGLQELFRGATSDFRHPEPLRTVGAKREPITMELPPRCVWWMASADDVADDQFHNRCLQPWCDDSDAADREFFEHMLHEEAYGDDETTSRQFAVCRAMWRRIEAEVLPVWVWFTTAIRFGDQRNRRNGKIFVDIIKAFARIRFMQRNRDDRGRIVATFDDFRDALAIYHELTDTSGSQVNQMTPDEARLLRLVEMMQRDSFNRNDLVAASGLPTQRIYRILHGRPDRGTGGLMEKCPALTVKDVSVSLEDDGIRRGHRENRYYFDAAVYRAWSGRGAVAIDPGTAREAFSHFSRSFPGLFPSWENTQSRLSPPRSPIEREKIERERERGESLPEAREHADTHTPTHTCVCDLPVMGKDTSPGNSKRTEEARTENKGHIAEIEPLPIVGKEGKEGKRGEKTPHEKSVAVPLQGAIDLDDLIPAPAHTKRCQVCQTRMADLKSKDGHVWICHACQRIILRARASEMGMRA